VCLVDNSISEEITHRLSDEVLWATPVYIHFFLL